MYRVGQMLSRIVDRLKGRKYLPDPMDASPDAIARQRRQAHFPLPEDKDDRKREQNRRDLVIQKYVQKHGHTKVEFGVTYGPFYTEGLALRALEEDRERNPGFYR